MTALPVLFADHPVPDVYRDLFDGRATLIGPDFGELANAAGVIAGARHPWNAAAWADSPGLRVISRVGIGYDNVDVAAATASGIVVCNAPDGPTVSTAEHTITLMLALGRELPSQLARAKDGLSGLPTGTALEFDGRTLGLVGYGRIARRVARVGHALGMTVLAHDPFVSSTDADDPVSLVDLPTVLSTSDVISLHAPATPDTKHMLSTPTFAAMKPGVLIVNCARGALIDQAALLAALDAGQVGGAALDVTDPEPLPSGHPLLAHPRVLVTPHIASSTGAGRRRLYAMAVDNALNVLAGRPASVVTA